MVYLCVIIVVLHHGQVTSVKEILNLWKFFYLVNEWMKMTAFNLMVPHIYHVVFHKVPINKIGIVPILKRYLID